MQLPKSIYRAFLLLIILSMFGISSTAQSNGRYSETQISNLLISAKSSLNNDNFNTALKTAVKAMALALEGRDVQKAWEANNLIGETYLAQKNYKLAIQLFLQMATTSESVKNYSISANAYLSLANIYASMGAYIKANETYAIAFEQFGQIDYELGLIEVKAASSFNHLRATQYDLAEFDFNKLLKLSILDSLPYFQLIAMDGLLEVYQLKGDFKKGIESSENYLNFIEQEGGSDQMNIRAYNQIALLYLNNSEEKKSIEYLNKAEELGSKPNAGKNELATTYNIYVRVFEASGDEAAKNSYLKKHSALVSSLPPSQAIDAESIKKAEALARELERNARSTISNQSLDKKSNEKNKRLARIAQDKSQLKSLEHQALIGNRSFGHSALEAEYTHQDLMVAQHKFESTERQAEILRYKKQLAFHQLELKVAEEEKTIYEQQNQIHQKQKIMYFIVGGGLFIIALLFGFEYFRTKKTNNLLAQQQVIIHARNTELENGNATIMSKNAKLQRAHHEINEANILLKNTQANLIQAEKMSALGLLTAGIAHEINNPISFVSNGLQVISDNFKEAFDTMEAYEDLAKLDDLSDIKDKYAEIKSHLTDIALQKSDLNELINDALFGTVRIVEIVDGLRIFSRKDELRFKKANLPEILDSALLITKSKYKGRVQIIKEYGDDIPEVDCFPGQLNQIFINLISNASDAIEKNGWIKLILKNISNKYVRVIVQDSGSGMPEDVIKKIFEPLFTTKESGKGTGLGLSISSDLIKTHQGHIDVRSKIGLGTAFIITLRIDINTEEVPEPTSF